MDVGKHSSDLNPLLATSYCLSPGEEDSVSKMASGPISSLIAFNEKEIDAELSELPQLDFLSMVFPPTPDNSFGSNFDGEHSNSALLEETEKASDIAHTRICSESITRCMNGEEQSSGFDDKYVPPAETKTSPASFFNLLSTSSSQTEVIMPAESLPTNRLDTSQTYALVPVTNLALGAINIDDHCIDSQNQSAILNTPIVDTSLKETSTVSSAIPTDLSGKLKKEKKIKNALKFPPCVICSGRASGSHYGAITCEACKGFFRRYLQKKIEFKCTKGGNCEIKSCNRGNLNCSGCRLQKCLAYGMSKDKSKMGRYTLTKRTDAIINMKKLESKVADDKVKNRNDISIEGNDDVKDGEKVKKSLNDSSIEESEIDSFLDEIDLNSCDPEREILKAQVIQNVKNLNRSNGFNDTLVLELMEALDALHPCGPGVKTKEQIIEAHKLHSERYQQKTALFGQMKCLPKDEYNKIYEEVGIDIDGRMAAMKIECENAEQDMELYYNFAKHIPGFYCLPLQDQIKLLKYSMNDFYVIISMDSYSEEHQTFLDKNGNGCHFEELADRELSRHCCTLVTETFRRWQGLALSRDETALIAALVLVTTDRCRLRNYAAVEKIQLALTDLLRLQLEKNDKSTAGRRFAKIIDTLVFTRNTSEVLLKENNIFCQDELMAKNFPWIQEFYLEEID